MFPHVILGKHLGVALTVKKNAYGLTFVLALLLPAAAGLLLVDLANANPISWVVLPRIDINADGTITPDTGYISRNGSTYTLTSDIIDEYSIDIWRSNIVFDGAGHTINITTAGNYNVLQGVTNVTVKNLQVYNSYRIAISLPYCSNCTITNVKTNHQISVSGYYNTIKECTSNICLWPPAENNLFIKNNITDIFIGEENFNTFSQNNILFVYVPDTYFKSTNFWDNGSVGNYWSDYLARYPNASEIGDTGIGDTPYVVDADNVDYHPLMYPYDIENDAITLPAREPEPFPTALVVASTVSLAAIGVGLLFYFRKRKR